MEHFGHRQPVAPRLAGVLAFALTAALAGGATAAWADEARIPIAGPITIGQPGYYIVTRDFCFASSAAPPCAAASVAGINIQANDVTVDLNGHTLTDNGGVMGVKIWYMGTPTRGLIVKNGRLAGGPGSTLSDHGLSGDSTNQVQVRIQDVEIRDFGGNCVDLAAADSIEIERSRLLGCKDAVNVIGTSGTFRGRFVDNVIGPVAGHGLALYGLGGGLILHNIIRAFGTTNSFSAGIYLGSLASSPIDAGANVIQENTITSGLGAASGARGIWIDSSAGPNAHNALVGNIVRENTLAGITIISDDSRLERNIVGKNGSQGIVVGTGSLGARMLIDGNQIESNGACGLSFNNTLSHVYRNNVIRGNGGGDVCGFAAPSTNGGGNVCTAACP